MKRHRMLSLGGDPTVSLTCIDCGFRIRIDSTRHRGRILYYEAADGQRFDHRQRQPPCPPPPAPASSSGLTAPVGEVGAGAMGEADVVPNAEAGPAFNREEAAVTGGMPEAGLGGDREDAGDM